MYGSFDIEVEKVRDRINPGFVLFVWKNSASQLVIGNKIIT